MAMSPTTMFTTERAKVQESEQNNVRLPENKIYQNWVIISTLNMDLASKLKSIAYHCINVSDYLSQLQK